MKSKMLLFLGVSIGLLTSQSHCMLSHWQHEPQQSSSTLNKYRDEICHKLVVDGTNITSIKPVKSDENRLQCNQYAFKKVLGNVPSTPFFTIYNYLRQVSDPKPDDFVCYTRSKTDLRGTHMGFIDADGTLKSKWGNRSYEIGHTVFSAPDIYGNAAGYFRLIPPYDTKKQVCIDFLNRDGEITYYERLRDVDKNNTAQIISLLSI